MRCLPQVVRSWSRFSAWKWLRQKIEELRLEWSQQFEVFRALGCSLGSHQRRDVKSKEKNHGKETSYQVACSALWIMWMWSLKGHSALWGQHFSKQMESHEHFFLPLGKAKKNNPAFHSNKIFDLPKCWLAQLPSFLAGLAIVFMESYFTEQALVPWISVGGSCQLLWWSQRLLIAFSIENGYGNGETPFVDVMWDVRVEFLKNGQFWLS